MMSGSDLCKWSIIEDDHYPLEQARFLARRLTCNDRNIDVLLDCLRQRNGLDIINSAKHIWVRKINLIIKYFFFLCSFQMNLVVIHGDLQLIHLLMILLHQFLHVDLLNFVV
jgi:hypothetical protein